MKNSKTFCPLAWGHNFINVDGSFQVCCVSDSFENNIVINGENVKVNNALSFEKILNSDTLKDIRMDMINSRWPTACQRCKLTEDGGGVSSRIKEFGKYSHLVDKMIENTDDKGEVLNATVYSLDLRLGNSCNLSCTMCDPHYSKSLVNNWNSISLEKIDEDKLDKLSSLDWDKDDFVLEYVESLKTDLLSIHFGGGEPFVNSRVLEILKLLIDKECSAKIDLSFNTNITIIPKWAEEVFPQFKSVNLFCSIDAVGPLNDYIRKGSRWNIIDRNLKYIDVNFRKLNIKECIVNVTVQMQNILKLEEIYSYLSTFENVEKTPYLSNLYFPKYLSTQALSPELKKMASQKIDHLIDAQGSHDGRNNLAEIKKFMNGAFFLKENLRFYKYINQLEKYTNMRLSKLIPELFNDKVEL